MMKVQLYKASDNLNAPGFRVGRLYVDFYNRSSWLRGVFVSWNRDDNEVPGFAARVWFFWTGLRGEVYWRGELYHPQIRFAAYLPTWIRVHILEHWQSLRHDISYDAYCQQMGFYEQYEEKPVHGSWGHRWQRTWTTLELVKRLTMQIVCKVRGHNYEHEEFVAAEYDELGRMTDIDGGGVYYWCKRCGHYGRSWF